MVRSLHLLRPQDADYDLSFSEPEAAFSIFVSVPQERTANDALRVAEEIIHEAMHLQLTLVEQATPLATSSSKVYYSPWRGEFRNTQGIIHALYVFRVIDVFLKQLNSTEGFLSEEMTYMENRHREIECQISGLRDLKNCAELTGAGACLADRLI